MHPSCLTSGGRVRRNNLHPRLTTALLVSLTATLAAGCSSSGTKNEIDMGQQNAPDVVTTAHDLVTSAPDLVTSAPDVASAPPDVAMGTDAANAPDATAPADVAKDSGP